MKKSKQTIFEMQSNIFMLSSNMNKKNFKPKDLSCFFSILYAQRKILFSYAVQKKVHAGRHVV